MVTAGPGRISRATIKRQPMYQQKRKCTRADPTQTRILLENYESEARPSAAQFVDISQETNLPVEWIKKWFLRKRKADGNNVAPTPPVPTFVENEPPAHGSQVLGHAHSKFWSMDAFVAADSTNFSPSVGYIPKFYGHRKHSVPPGIRGDCTTDSRENREAREIFSPGASTGTGYGYASPSDSVLTCGCVETATPTTCDPREALLGADAVVGHFSSANDDTLGFPCEHLSGTLTVDDPASTALLPAAASPERSTYIDNLYDEGYSGSEGASDFGFDLTNYSVSVSSPLDMIDDFILASKDLDFVSATTEDFELGALDPTTGHVGLDSSSPSSSDGPDDMTKILGEHSALYESLLMQITNQDPMGDTVNWIDSRDLLGTDDYLGAVPTATKDELKSTSALGLSLVNFDNGTCYSAAPKDLFGGFGGGDDSDLVGVDPGEKGWRDGLGRMLD